MSNKRLPIEPEFYTPIAIIAGSLIIAFSIIAAGGGGGAASASLSPTSAASGGTTPPPSGSKVELSVESGDHARGNPSAPVTIIEYSDLECPFCQQFHPTMQRVLSEYGDKVRWVYRHFPLDQIHSQARPAAEASECVAEQKGNEGFWTFVDYIFDNQSRIGSSLFREAAQLAGADLNAFDSCVASGKYADKVQADNDSGLKAGVTGTPGSFVNGTPVRGALPFDQLKTIIDQELAQ